MQLTGSLVKRQVLIQQVSGAGRAGGSPFVTGAQVVPMSLAHGPPFG